MANKTDILFAAALSGITAGVQDGKDYSQVSTATYSTAAAEVLTAAIAAAASAVDAAVGFDSELAVSSSSPVLLVTPFAGSGTAAQILPFFSKPTLLAAICHSAFRGKGDLESAVASTYTLEAAGIAAQYVASVANLPTS